MESIGAAYPASAAQQRLWFIDRVADQRSRPAYLVPTVIEFTGPVDRDVLRRAVALVLGRHPALRSRFTLERSRRQVLCRTDGRAPTVELTDAGAARRAQPEIDRQVRGLCWAPFDLATDPPARAGIIAAGDRTVFVLCAHHIVLDGWSRQLLMEEIGEAYRAVAQQREPRLPDPVHPAEVAAPEPAGRAERTAEVVASLRGAPLDVRLPRDRPRPAVQPTLGATRSGWLGPELTARLRGVAGDHGCTTFMTVAALLAATLSRRSSQRDFLFAFPWLGRETPASRSAVGMFVDTLLLRVDLSGRPSWRELLDRVRRASLTSYGNADVPFDTLAAALHRDRDLSRPPITPVMVNVLDGSLRPPDLGPGIHGRQLPLDPYHVRYELALDVTDASDDLLLALDYPVELFDATTVAGLLAALRRAATDLVTDPEASVIDTSENGDDDQTGGGQPAAAGAKVALPDETGATDFVDQVRAAWRVVLDTDEVPLDVNFLDAGGDSLLLVLLLDELNTLTDRKLQAADLFRSGTVAGQARLLRERQGDQPPAGDAAAADGTGGRGQLLDRARRVRAEEPAPEWTPSDQAGGRGP